MASDATPLVLFQVTVPAPDEASKVRNYIIKQKEVEWVSEQPFLNGNTWWASFLFSCRSSYTGTAHRELHGIGVGDEENGCGMIHLMALHGREIGSRPKNCGYPSSLPYGVTPPARSDSTTVIPMGDTTSKDTPGSPDAASTAASASKADDASTNEAFDASLQQCDQDFSDTIASRCAVDSLIKYVTKQSEFTFDYVMLIVIAAIIACVGLVTDNGVVVIASMLVSPLMGPILAFSLGSIMSDHKLTKRGSFGESIGLVICLIVGFIGGLCSAPANGETWPTDEMASRAVPSALHIGVAIAIPSGMGAALAVMGSNTASLVGVAISASLLPPAVNSGILFAAAALNNSGYINDGDYENLAPIQGALISLGLTLVNIICVKISAGFMFIVKEFAGANAFWKNDIPNVRKFNEAMRDPAQRNKYESAFNDQVHFFPLLGKIESDLFPGETPLDKLRGSIHLRND